MYSYRMRPAENGTLAARITSTLVDAAVVEKRAGKMYPFFMKIAIETIGRLLLGSQMEDDAVLGLWCRRWNGAVKVTSASS